MPLHSQSVLCDAQQNFCDEQTVLGTIRSDDLRPGLSLHSTDITVRAPLAINGDAPPGLRLILMLEGKMRARFGAKELLLDAGRRPQGVLLPLSQPETLSRQLRAGEKQKQVVVTVEPRWFEEGGYAALADHHRTRALCGRHLAAVPLGISTRLAQLGRALAEDGGAPASLQRLQRECQALELMLTALSQLSPTAPRALRPAELRRARDLASLLDSGDADHWTLARLARELGSNPTTLQRQFQAVHGQSIGDYLKQSRLARARALLQGGASVTEAALAAGYASPANFATAFRRHYGLRPSQARNGACK